MDNNPGTVQASYEKKSQVAPSWDLKLRTDFCKIETKLLLGFVCHFSTKLVPQLVYLPRLTIIYKFWAFIQLVLANRTKKNDLKLKKNLLYRFFFKNMVGNFGATAQQLILLANHYDDNQMGCLRSAGFYRSLT